MLRTIAFLALTLSLVCPDGFAQSADELIQKHIEASGGLERIKSVTSRKQVGTFSGMGGMEMDMTVYHKRPNKVRSEVTVQGTDIITAFDGTTAWTINPIATGSTEATKLPPEQAAAIRDDIDGPLVDYEEKGYTIEYDGEAELDGEEAYRLKVTTSEGEQNTIYLDADTYLAVKQEQEVEDPRMGGMVKIETYMSDYREVEGLMVPFSVEVAVNGQPMQKITIKEVEINADVNDALFAFPVN